MSRALRLLPLLLVLPLLLFAQQAPVDDPTPARTRAATDAVFDDPAYQAGLDTSHVTLEDVIALARHLVGSFFGWIADTAKSLYQDSPLILVLICVILLMILALLLWHIGSTFASAFRGTAGGQVEADEEDPSARAARYRDLRAEADRLAEAGKHDEAVRTLLLALLALLSEEQVLAVARSWTPRETLARLSERAGAPHALDPFRVAAEDALYGPGRTAQTDYTGCARIVDDLVPRLRQRR